MNDLYKEADCMYVLVQTGGEVLVGLNATQPMVYFVYQVLGRGDVVFGETLQAHEGTTHTFR